MNLSQSIKSRLQFQHETVGELMHGYDHKQLKMRVIPDKWSVWENIAHLVSYQLIFQERIVRVLVEDNPLFERYMAENDPVFDEY